MTASRTLIHRIGWGASGLMMVAAAVGMSVPAASAAASPDGRLSLDVLPPPGGYVVGVRADITVEGVGGSMFPVVPQSWVTLSDNGACVYSFWPGHAPSGSSYLSWVPTTAGTHTVSITHYGTTVSETVTVNPAPDGAPVPTPETPGCSNVGSIDTGSLGS
jgi:hypothetical protein